MNVGNIQSGATWEYSVNSGENWSNGTGTSFTLTDGAYIIDQVQVRQTVGGVTSDITTNANPIIIAKNQIVNGDFQQGNTGFTTNYTYD